MKFVESTMRYAIPAAGLSVRWLKDELSARNVSVRLTDACLRELVMDADAAAQRQAYDLEAPRPYLSRLRREIAARAEFLNIWTLSDEPLDLDDPFNKRLVIVARKYALPRPWRLSEPVASECQRRTPTYGHWAGAT
jgi:hypothetical protein